MTANKPPAPPSRATLQPFRGASLPPEMTAVLKPAIDEVGAAHLLRAMTLAWQSLPSAQRAAHLAATADYEDATIALRATGLADAKPVTAKEMAAAAKTFEAARASFAGAAMTLSTDELFVARMRFVPPAKRPTLEEVAAKLGGTTKEWVRQLEERARLVLSQWLIALIVRQDRP